MLADNSKIGESFDHPKHFSINYNSLKINDN
jgi:hypothetical protein